MSDNTVKSQTTLVITQNEDGAVDAKVDWEQSTHDSDADKVVASALLIALSDEKVFQHYLEIAKTELARIKTDAKEGEEDASE